MTLVLHLSVACKRCNIVNYLSNHYSFKFYHKKTLKADICYGFFIITTTICARSGQSFFEKCKTWISRKKDIFLHFSKMTIPGWVILVENLKQKDMFLKKKEKNHFIRQTFSKIQIFNTLILFITSSNIPISVCSSKSRFVPSLYFQSNSNLIVLKNHSNLSF